MIRKIIEINEEKCNGCGACAAACHEGAIGMVNGKAKLRRDDYCDGLGNCLPACPTGAITFTEREAAAYDEAAVQAHQQRGTAVFAGCPGSRAQVLQPCAARPAPVASAAPAAPSWTGWIMQKNSPKFCAVTRSKASVYCVCRCPAAVGWSTRCKLHCVQAAK